MRPPRSLLAAALTLIAAILPAGCQNPERIRVLEPLPPPIINPPTPTPIPTPTPPPPITGLPIRGAVIVIDPGHGGKDPGAPARFSGQMAEKNIVLDIGSRVARILSERGARVIMTRSGDTYPERQERADLAEHSRADLFISIHADSDVYNRNASGAAIHIFTEASAQSQKAAFRMVAAFNRAGIECRGISRNNYLVLREHSRPAMLIECGFLTNYSDAQKLNSAAYRAQLAAVIADGAVGYFAP